MFTDLNFLPVKSNMGDLSRAKVPGGWILMDTQNIAHYTEHRGFVDGHDWRTAICFVPDHAEPKKCKFSVYDKSMEGPVQSRYAEKDGLFHRWGTEVVDAGESVAEGTVAIVEDETGQIHLVNPTRIKFIDPQN